MPSKLDPAENADLVGPLNRREAILVEAERIAQMGSYEWDVHTGKVYRSDELCRIFGVTLEEFKPTFEGYLERVHPEDREHTRTTVQNAYRDKMPFEFEERIVHPDGSVRDLRSQGKWLFDAAQNPVKLIGICQDITERKRAQQKLRESEERYRAVVENVPEGIIVTIDQKIVFANAACATLLGVANPGNLFGRPIEDFIHPEFYPLLDRRREQMGLTGEPAPAVEVKLRAASGAIDAHMTGIPIVYHGHKAILRSFRNITESKFAAGLLSAEKHVLECIANRLPLADILDEICQRIEVINPPVEASVMLLDPDAKHLYPAAAPSLPKRWAKAITPLAVGPIAGACGTAAYTRHTVVADDIAHDPLWTAYPDVLKIALDCGLRACWSTPILSAANELLGTFALYYKECRKPTPRDFDLIKQVTHLASVAIEHDRALTGLQRAQSELEQRVRDRTAELVNANERLKELDHLKSLFLANMSHELRTPLNSIIGFTGILGQGLAGPINDEQKKQLGIVTSASRHLLTLINDLLDVSRIEAGKMDLDRAPFDFVPVVNEAIATLKPLVDQKNLSLTSEVSPSQIPMIGDRKRMFQILLNLLNNAIKFTDRGSVEVIVRIEGQSLSVCVADTGIGIKQEQMGMLFEAFRQLDASRKRVYEGTGLGLHLCRKLVTLMHGQIGAESLRGRGSRFTFTVPLEQPGPN